MQGLSGSIVKKFNVISGFSRRKKLFLGSVFILGFALAGYLLWGGAKKASGNFLTDTVKRTTITSTISASGTVEPVSTVSLSFKNSEV
ncbi:MAG: hypothetical protein K6U74_13875, partial [Firmicutes bacterium]|nr:hypothetical protein [Bacillota bacterium]